MGDVGDGAGFDAAAFDVAVVDGVGFDVAESLIDDGRVIAPIDVIVIPFPLRKGFDAGDDDAGGDRMAEVVNGVDDGVEVDGVDETGGGDVTVETGVLIEDDGGVEGLVGVDETGD